MLVRLSSLSFSDGSSVPIPHSGVVAIIGPNNSGKSRALRDIWTHCKGEASDLNPAVVTGTQWHRQGSSDDVHAYPQDSGKLYSDTGRASVELSEHHTADLAHYLTEWTQGRGFASVSPFVLFARTDSRLKKTEPVAPPNRLQNESRHALHAFGFTPSLLTELSSATMLAFETEVFLDKWSAGGPWLLRTGSRPQFGDGEPGDEEIQTMSEANQVAHEGDGVRAFVGLLLDWLAARHQIALIDEPEAFLHPPQAQMLGHELARLTREGDRQLVVSTHSRAFLLGLLSAGTPLTVIRIDRQDMISRPSVLNPGDIHTLWSDPLLRQSDIFDGLFSETVVLCEAEADCAFYSEALQYIDEHENDIPMPISGPTMRHTGSKDRLHIATSALRRAGVPVSVVADIDTLNDTTSFGRIVTAMGGTPREFQSHLASLKETLAGAQEERSIADLRNILLPILGRAPGETPSSSEVRAIKDSLKARTQWKEFGERGTALLDGDALENCLKLLEDCANIGLHLVPSGALESWAPGLPGHGKRWLSMALEPNQRKYVRFSDARNFVRQAIDRPCAPIRQTSIGPVH